VLIASAGLPFIDLIFVFGIFGGVFLDLELLPRLQPCGLSGGLELFEHHFA
jgi:hypothetical protein